MSDLNFANYGVMIKKQMLNDMHRAKIAHKRWLRRVKHLVDNLPVDIKTLPVDAKKSEFAQWFYTSGIKCKQIPQLEYYVSLIDFLYSEMHTSYLKIHSLYTADTNSSKLVNILIPSKRKLSAKQLRIAQFYLNDIENLSNELFKFIDLFERHLAIQANENLIAVI